jgi:predicted NUDIX family phosphoesterase
LIFYLFKEGDKEFFQPTKGQKKITTMEQDKLHAIGRKLEVVFTKEKFILPVELQNKIDEFWDTLIKDGNKYTRGEVFTISNIEEKKDETIVNVDLSDYAHYLYTRRVGLPEKNACKNLHTSCLIETSDSMLIFGRMGKQTSMPGNIQCVGGGLDNEDIQGSVIDLTHNIKKELLEEVGINVDSEKLVSAFDIKYLRYDSNVHSVAAIFILKLKITSKEFADLYNVFEAQIIASGELPEFGELVYLKKNKSEIDDFYEKEKKYFDHYMMPLLEEVVS